MSFGYDNELHANEMERVNEQREYARIEHEKKMTAARDDRRERIARAAMQGLITHGTGRPSECAELSCEYADALIAELDKEGKA